MPLRLDSLARRWSTLDLPIFPFLAPRVFQPWPASCRPNLSAPTKVRRSLHSDSSSSRTTYNTNDGGLLTGERKLQAGENATEATGAYKERIEKEREKKIAEIILKHKKQMEVISAQIAQEERELGEQRKKEELQLMERRRREDQERMARIQREEAERKRSVEEQDKSRKAEIEARERRLFLEAEAMLKRLEDEMERKLAMEEEKERRFQGKLTEDEKERGFQEKLAQDEEAEKREKQAIDSLSALVDKSNVERHDIIKGKSKETTSGEDAMILTSHKKREYLEFSQKFRFFWGPKGRQALTEERHIKKLSKSRSERQLLMNQRRRLRLRRPGIWSAKEQRTFLVRRYYDERYWYQKKRSRSFPSAAVFRCRYEEWYRRFSILCSGPRGLIREAPSLISYSTWIFPKTFKDEFINHESSSSLHQAWKAIPPKSRVRLWPELLITTLKDCPAKAMKVLCGTYSSPYPPQRPFCDVLNFIIWHYLRYANPSDENPALELFKIISRLLSVGPKDYIELSQTSIYLLMVHLPGLRYVEELYRTVDRSNNPLHYDTLVQFADRLAKGGGSFRETAYEIMEKIGSMPAVDFNIPQMLSLSTTLIMRAGEDTTFNHNQVFEFLLMRGLRPNLITYNTLLYKTLQAGDANRGWQIHELMKENGVEPNAYTYSILLNDAKRRYDQPAIRHITNIIEEKSLWNPIIVTDMLHIMFLEDLRYYELELKRAQRENWKRGTFEDFRPIDKMLPIYCQYFQFEPLARLIPGLGKVYKLITKLDSLPPQTDVLIEPRPAVLVVMITALLRSYDDEHTPRIFYDNFRKMIKNNDPIIADMAASHRKHETESFHFRHVYNLTLLALGQAAKGIPDCVEILQDMCRPPPPLPEPDAEGIIPYVPLHPPKPDDTTWNVMVTIFMKHRQARAAEKVIGMMKARGVEPTEMTWHRLLQGYTLMQDTRQSIDVLERLTQSGFDVNSHTWSTLRRLRDRRALMEGMKRIEEERDQKAFSDMLKVQSLANRPEVGYEKGVDESPLKEAELEEFVVGDMETSEHFADVNKYLTVWRRLELFRNIDASGT